MEASTCERLACLALETFFPTIRSRRIRGGRIVYADRPLFPSYVFARLSDRWQRACRVHGVSRVLTLTNENRPVVVPDAVIVKMRSLNTNDGPRFSRGQKVRIVRGIIEGSTATFDKELGQQQARVLIDMLGYGVPAIVDINDLECST